MKVGLGSLNYSVLISYLLAIFLAGSYFAKRSGESTDIFFKAGGRIPGWAVGISIFATTLSAITFMSIPALSYRENWAMGFNNLSIIAISPFVVTFAVPFFRKLAVTSAYEYLEHRFDIKVRLLGSFTFVTFHLLRIAIVIYLPTLALKSVAGINPVFITIAIGILCIFYTLLGGIEGVIWAEVVQGVLLLVGSVLIVIFLLLKISNVGTETYQAIMHKGKLLTTDNFNLSLLHPTIVGIFICGIFNSLYQYIGSQDVVQRYNTTSNIKETSKAIYLNAKLAFLAGFLFFGMGTLLYIYYNQNLSLLPKNFNLDSVVPYFIVSEVPAGIAGFIIASIIASAQATISSSLNGISACIITDIRKRFFRRKDEKAEVLWARLVVFASGIVSTSIALYMTVADESDLQVFFQSVLGMFGGPISGAFIAGIFFKRINGNSIFISMILSGVILFFVQRTSAYFMYYGIIGVLSTITISYMLSFIFPQKRICDGLTYNTINKKAD